MNIPTIIFIIIVVLTAVLGIISFLVTVRAKFRSLYNPTKFQQAIIEHRFGKLKMEKTRNIFGET